MLGESLERQGGIVSVEKLILSESLPGVSFQHVATLPNGSGLTKVVTFTRALALLLRQLIFQSVDLIHVHVSERGSAYRQMITALVVQTFGKPVIMHAHSSNFHEFFPNNPVLIQHLMAWVFRRCNYFIVLSESWRNFYIQSLNLYPERVVVLSNPVRVPYQIPDRQGSKPLHLVFLGRIGERKGAFDLLLAFAQLPSEQRQHIILTLAGDGEVEKARDLLKQLNLETNVRILDWIDELQRESLLSKADIFILPSYNEGLPMALLEAMSWGLPCISTPVGGIPELLIHGKNGLLVQPGVPQELAKAIQTLLEDETLRLTLGKAARQTVMPLDIREYMDSMLKLYNSALEVSNS